MVPFQVTNRDGTSRAVTMMPADGSSLSDATALSRHSPADLAAQPSDPTVGSGGESGQTSTGSLSSAGLAGAGGSAPGFLPSDLLQPSVPQGDKTVISSRPPAESLPPPITPQHLGQTLVGKKLEHYELVEFVGGGGMGAVFRANDMRLGRTVAVKVLSRDQTDDETIRRFRNEAQSAARLDHPNIARVYYVGEDQGWNFIVFEFIQGINLRDLVEQRGPLPLEEALIYTLQVAEALAHSSGRDVVHRDIKPSNVLVTADGAVKLVDMGLARLHQVQSSSDDLTASGVTLGTFDYISPEQARDPRCADVRSDIYSLGCTLFYMLTGRPPFADGTALQKLIRHSQDDPEDVRLFRPELPPRLTALLARMLAKRPSQRPQSALELMAEIASLAEQAGLASVLAKGHVVVTPASRQPQFWARAAQVAVAVVLLLAAIVALDAYAPGRPLKETVAMQPKLAPRPTEPTAASTPSTAEVATSSPSSPVATAAPSSAQAADAARSATTDLTAAAASSAPVPDSSPSAGIGAESAAPTAGGSANADNTSPGAGGLDGSTGGIGPPPMLAQISIPLADGLTSLAPPSLGASGPAVKIQRLVVARQLPPVAPAGTEYQTSLAAACRRAAELNLGEVELAYSGPLVESPLEIAHPQLLLKAASGERPAIVFRPQLSLATGGQQMIRLAGGPTSKLIVQGVDLSLALPEEPSSGWALLGIRAGQSLDFSDCVLTVQDGDATRPPAQTQVAMIAVQPRAMNDAMAMEPQAAMASGTSIVMSRVIARGEATMISLSEDVPLQLRWDQGLLVTPHRLLETTGAASKPQWYEQIGLTLENVTAVCGEGLFQMRRRPGASHHFGVEAAISRCILMTDAGAPLYEYVGVTEPSQLRCGGELNRYPQPDVIFLSVAPATGGGRTYGLGERGNWSMETQPQPLPPIAWRQPPSADRPAHDQTKQDFELSPAAQLEAGFDPALLPSVRTPAHEPADVAPAGDFSQP